ncbi:hypothetical protein MW887_004108 [Aspergillus wentii]|nr:hypothetical protein MW887_004108 [Aspergillus wentii]
MAASTQAILSLADEIKSLATEESTSPSGARHVQLLQRVDELKLAIESPTDTILRLIYQPPQNAALRTVIDLGIFPLLVESKSGVSAAELEELRLMRVMAGLGLCASHESEVYSPTDKTLAMTQPIGRDGVSCLFDLVVPTLSKLPEYLRLHNYSNPKEYSRSPMQWAVGKSQFEWMNEHKEQQTTFNSYMSSRREGKPSWFDVYPIESLIQEAVPCAEMPFIVDVGGNQGHDLAKLRDRYPNHPGRLILQDLPKIVAPVDRPGIETMGYSFLDPQPVKGALAYYFRAIFHDWPDHICQKILLNTISAMDPKYSRILIVDWVLPDTKAPLLQSSMDIQMMSIGAGVERSERQWRELLGGAGLEIKQIHNSHPGMESIIEAVRIGSEASA